MALGEAAEVDAHAVAREAHRARVGVEQQVSIADRGPRAGQLVVARLDRAAIVVEAADARVRDVERTVRQLGELNRSHKQRVHLVADRHRDSRGVAIDARQLRVRLERAHGAIDAMHLRHHRRSGSLAGRAVAAPQLDAHGRAHDGFLAAHPARVRPRSSQRSSESEGAMASLRRAGHGHCDSLVCRFVARCMSCSPGHADSPALSAGASSSGAALQARD